MLVTFSIGRYKDEVWCDVVPIYAGHMLLGRPWQYDRRVMHDGFKNRYSLIMEGQKYQLGPLPPKTIFEDQMHIKQQYEDPESSLAETLGREQEREKKKGEFSGKNESNVKHKGRENKEGLSERKMSVYAICTRTF